MAQQTDRIEKQVLLRAPLDRVWRAVSDAKQFGTWFGVDFDGAFVPGTRITGRITPTKVDAEIAKLQEPHKGKAFEFFIERIEPMHVMSMRWHPFAIDPKVDYSDEPTTLIVFQLEKAPDGTLLRITESGFDRIPLARRAQAFAANERGCEAQTNLLQKYLAQMPADVS